MSYNPEKYQANREEYLKKCKAYYDANSEAIKEYHRKYRAANKDKTAEANKRYREKNREKLKSYDHKRYKADGVKRSRLGKHERLAGRPKPDKCEIPGCTGTDIHWDHCHTSGLFRGWICGSCNTTLGFIKDNPARLRALADYLEVFYNDKTNPIT